MRPISLNRGLDVHYIGRDISLKTRAKELDLRFPRRKVIYRGGDMREFWYYFTKYSRMGGAGSVSRTPYFNHRRNPVYRSWPEKGKAPGGSRRSTVKISYTNHKGVAGLFSNNKKIAYIAREEATLAEGRPDYEDATEQQRMYTYNRYGAKQLVSVPAAQAMLGDYGIFRIILSPEDSNVDLSEFARRFMEKSFFKAIGCRTDMWVAANHYNTDHPHIHILVSRKRPERSVIRTGDDGALRFDKSYVQSGTASSQACRILTDFMGPRTLEEHRKINTRIVESPGFQEIDQTLQKIGKRDKDGVLTIGYPDLKEVEKERRELARRRLKYMSKFRAFVSYDEDNRTWTLDKGWENELRKNDAMAEMGLPLSASERFIYDGGETRSYSGKISAFKMLDDDPDEILFKIVDEEGRFHLHKERLPEDVDRSLLIGGYVEIGPTEHGRMSKIMNIGQFAEKTKNSTRRGRE